MKNIDDLAVHIRNVMMQCDKIRIPLKLGPVNLTAEQSKMLADAMDLHIARPLVSALDSPAGNNRSHQESERSRSRYCYAKIVPSDQAVHEMFRLDSTRSFCH